MSTDTSIDDADYTIRIWQMEDGTYEVITEHRERYLPDSSPIRALARRIKVLLAETGMSPPPVPPETPPAPPPMPIITDGKPYYMAPTLYITDEEMQEIVARKRDRILTNGVAPRPGTPLYLATKKGGLGAVVGVRYVVDMGGRDFLVHFTFMASYIPSELDR